MLSIAVCKSYLRLRDRGQIIWLKTDLSIVFKTIAVMGLEMGR